ncbi:MAG: OsmC family protein [Anaerolineae bacterium]|nr:OsmC family protein [Anaerolineae bacterium]
MSDTQVTWVEGMQFVAESAGHAVVIDGAPGFGRGTAIPSMRLLLVGTAGCSAMDVVHILKNRMRRDLTGLRVEVSAEQADEHPKVYTRIELRYLLQGRGLREKDVERAIELSNTKFCSAAIMMAKTAEIVTSYEIEEVD